MFESTESFYPRETGTVPSPQSNTTSNQQPRPIEKRWHEPYHAQESMYVNMRDQLKQEGISHLHASDLTAEQHEYLSQFMHAHIEPLLSPQIVNAQHPFPFLENGGLYVLANLATPSGANAAYEDAALGLIALPPQCDRIIQLPASGFSFILLEDAIELFAARIFDTYHVMHTNVICVMHSTKPDVLQKPGEVYEPAADVPAAHGLTGDGSIEQAQSSLANLPQPSGVTQTFIPEPVIAQPTVPQPIVPQSVFLQPVATQPAASQEAISQPVASQPVAPLPQATTVLSNTVIPLIPATEMQRMQLEILAQNASAASKFAQPQSDFAQAENQGDAHLHQEESTPQHEEDTSFLFQANQGIVMPPEKRHWFHRKK